MVENAKYIREGLRIETLEALGQLKNDSEPTNMSTLADETDDQWAFLNQNDDQGMDVGNGKAEGDGMEGEGPDTGSDDDANENDSGFKAKVIGVLKQYDYADKRSSKLTQNEFIHLLSVYNQAGIHFTSSKYVGYRFRKHMMQHEQKLMRKIPSSYQDCGARRWKI
ncbi:hypothetical protein Cgig2_012489 [Carnegiea gigantea]|uniref:Uncharacterized protein n=1 Tax=Carnegiea gigantea TaxID=171969 RepID=A0A9Q1QE02_9CARY|nr:hypothetical protein Cgig2_012489 [Carnegiea gigantea]